MIEIKTRTTTHSISFERVLGEVIVDLRCAHNWSQVELADKSTIHQSVLSRIERGGGTRLCNLRTIAAAFDMPLSKLIARAERRWEKL